MNKLLRMLVKSEDGYGKVNMNDILSESILSIDSTDNMLVMTLSVGQISRVGHLILTT